MELAIARDWANSDEWVEYKPLWNKKELIITVQIGKKYKRVEILMNLIVL